MPYFHGDKDKKVYESRVLERDNLQLRKTEYCTTEIMQEIEEQ